SRSQARDARRRDHPRAGRGGTSLSRAGRRTGSIRVILTGVVIESYNLTRPGKHARRVRPWPVGNAPPIPRRDVEEKRSARGEIGGSSSRMREDGGLGTRTGSGRACDPGAPVGRCGASSSGCMTPQLLFAYGTLMPSDPATAAIEGWVADAV